MRRRHSLFVIDLPPDALGNPEDVRFDLLRADGTEVLLYLLGDPIPAAPGLDVFVIDFGWLGVRRVRTAACIPRQRARRPDQ